jgi:CDGSH-type Zn-finger protein/uncharacterized Fe-S cluster protein YjdI
VYRGEKISVSYDLPRCMHASECVKGGLTAVFDRERRPWVLPDGADPDRVVDVVERCPSGALHYERHDGGADEVAETNSVRPQPRGALYLRGDLTLQAADGEAVTEEVRLALCRCGASTNKPFCDYRHHAAGFEGGGELGAWEGYELSEQILDTEGPLTITPLSNGPLLVEGAFALRSADNDRIVYGERAKFCRCGQSGNKPFCDGTPKRGGLEAE